MHKTTPKQREALQHVSDVVRATASQTQLIWFSASGSGSDIAGITAAFIDPHEALRYAVSHRSETVHFPDGVQLQALFAMKDGIETFLLRSER